MKVSTVTINTKNSDIW